MFVPLVRFIFILIRIQTQCTLSMNSWFASFTLPCSIWEVRVEREGERGGNVPHVVLVCCWSVCSGVRSTCRFCDFCFVPHSLVCRTHKHTDIRKHTESEEYVLMQPDFWRCLLSALLAATLRTYQRAGCDSEQLSLSCPRGTSISIELAQYGRAGGKFHCHVRQRVERYL